MESESMESRILDELKRISEKLDRYSERVAILEAQDLFKKLGTLEVRLLEQEKLAERFKVYLGIAGTVGGLVVHAAAKFIHG